VFSSHLVAEHVGPLLELFGAEYTIEAVRGAEFAEALEHRRADVAFGPSPGSDRVASAAFLRCRLVLVAASEHPLAAERGIAPSSLDSERWLVGQPELDPSTATGLFFTRHGLAPSSVRHFGSTADALKAAAAGEGIALTPAHAAPGLARLDVRGTPVIEMWHASTLGLGRALPAALALQRFATTPEATQAISSGRAGARSRPNVHVTLWQSVAARRP
jgi:DNA-binding transcriptional LysR family regulator